MANIALQDGKVVLKDGKASCACCSIESKFAIGIISVNSISSKTRCGLDALSALQAAALGVGELPDNDNIPFECFEFLLSNNKNLCDIVTGITESEESSSQTLCLYNQNNETFYTEEYNYGFNYILNITDNGPNAIEYSGDLYSNTASVNNSCSQAESMIPNNGFSALGAIGGELDDGTQIPDVTFNCGTNNSQGNFSFGEITFYSHSGVCDFNNYQIGYDPVTVQGYQTSMNFDTQDNSSFIGSVIAYSPPYPNYNIPQCLVNAPSPPPSSVESEFQYIVYTSEYCEQAKKIITGFGQRNLKFKIVHNVSPTGYLKVWIKKGRLYLGQFEFESFTYETYEHDINIESIPPEQRPCSIYTSGQEWELVTNLNSESILNYYDQYPSSNGSPVEYAYILKFSFVQGYEPQTSGTGTQEQAIVNGVSTNGYPPSNGGGGG